MKYLNKALLEENIEKIANTDILENNNFGSAYFVMQNGGKVFEKSYGVTGADGKQKVNPDTVFRIASMTKPITAIAILILAERGLLSVSDPVKKYFPQFENMHIMPEHGVDLGVSKTDVTIMHLLTHTSGIGCSKPSKMTSEEKKTVKNTIEYFVKTGLDFEPFTMQRYSAFGAFDVAVGLIEMLTGEDYEEFLQKEIFAPCGMKDTTFMPSDEQFDRMMSMHDKVNGKNAIGKTTPNCIYEDFPCEHKLGGAGLVSTLKDYSRFAQMLLNKGKTETSQIISEETFELMTCPYFPHDDLDPVTESWGLGVRVVTGNNANGLPPKSFGWSGAYGTHFWVDPENMIVAVFMRNSLFDGDEGKRPECLFEKAVYDALGE